MWLTMSGSMDSPKSSKYKLEPKLPISYLYSYHTQRPRTSVEGQFPLGHVIRNHKRRDRDRYRYRYMDNYKMIYINSEGCIHIS
jgi:hypothetical protein